MTYFAALNDTPAFRAAQTLSMLRDLHPSMYRLADGRRYDSEGLWDVREVDYNPSGEEIVEVDLIGSAALSPWDQMLYASEGVQGFEHYHLDAGEF